MAHIIWAKSKSDSHYCPFVDELTIWFEKIMTNDQSGEIYRLLEPDGPRTLNER